MIGSSIRCVLQKKRKSMFARIIRKFKPAPLPHEQEGMAFDFPLDDVRIDEDEAAVIAARRNELRVARHGNSDAMVTFDADD